MLLSDKGFGRVSTLNNSSFKTSSYKYQIMFKVEMWSYLGVDIWHISGEIF